MASANKFTFWPAGAAALSAAAVASALWNRQAAKQAERATPPIGQFVDVEGTTLHYLRRGQGLPVVLLHGNGTMIQDWCISGVFDRLAVRHDVIAFDRPGCGHSSRPRTVVWTPAEQAKLIVEGLQRLGIERATIVGHSFGSMVAAAIAAEYPRLVDHLVLLSGYYYPTARIDSVVNSPPALPVVGDVLRYTLSPLLGRAMKPAVYRQLFAPAAVTPAWKRAFPIEMTLRPSQIRAVSADGALMIPAAAKLAKRYGEWRMPVSIVTGDGDKVVDPEGQSMRLASEVPNSRLVVIRGAGHMVQHIDPVRVSEVIEGSEYAPQLAQAS